jgi:hypothetical protein
MALELAHPPVQLIPGTFPWGNVGAFESMEFYCYTAPIHFHGMVLRHRDKLYLYLECIVWHRVEFAVQILVL